MLKEGVFLDKFLEKISFYDILNNLIPGVIIVWMCDAFDIFSIEKQEIIEKVFLYYFFGIIVSRVGSIFVEPVIKLFFKRASHADYIEACGYDKKIEELNAVSNMYRTFVSVVLCVLLAKIYLILKDKIFFLQKANVFIMLGFLVVLFILSYVKQVKYIKSRVDVALTNNKTKKEIQE